MWRRCCCRHRRHGWDEYEGEDTAQPVKAIRQMIRRAGAKYAFIHGDLEEEDGPTAGPRTVLFTYLETRMAEARTAGASFVAVTQADMDQATGYRIPDYIVREVTVMITARHKPIQILYDHEGNDPLVLDWRPEDMTLLTNPERAGEPEDAGHS